MNPAPAFCCRIGFAAALFSFLAACGGGSGSPPDTSNGGGGNPSAALTPDERLQLQAAVAGIEGQVQNSRLSENEKTDLLTEIRDLENTIDELRAAFAELRAKARELEDKLQMEITVRENKIVAQVAAAVAAAKAAGKCPYAPVQTSANHGAFFAGRSRIGSQLILQRADFSILRNGATVTVNYRFSGAHAVHDHSNWNNLSEIREATVPGDIIKIIKVKSAKSDFRPGDEYIVMRDITTVQINAYSRAPEGLKNEDRYLAALATTCAGKTGETFFAAVEGEFAYTTEGGYSFHDNRQGLIDKNRALRLGGFLFAYNPKTQNLQAEHRFSAARGGATLYFNSGYQRRAGNTDFFYGQLAAAHPISPRTDLYLRAAAGEVSSDIYRNSRLYGIAAELRHRNFFRHDDSYFFRIGRPFSQNTAPRFLAAARIGAKNNFARLDIYRDWKNNNGGARITYRREF